MQNVSKKPFVSHTLIVHRTNPLTHEFTLQKKKKLRVLFVIRNKEVKVSV